MTGPERAAADLLAFFDQVTEPDWRPPEEPLTATVPYADWQQAREDARLLIERLRVLEREQRDA